MEINQNPDAGVPFGVYYDKVAKELKSKGYQTKPDRETVEMDWQMEKSIAQSVEEFVDEWGDPDFEPTGD